MSTYLKQKHSEFIGAIPQPPVIPIQHAPKHLNELAAHAFEVTHQYIEYMRSIAREAHGCGVAITPEHVAGLLHDAFHDTDLCQSIRDEAERMVERSLEDA
jgi:hypothetical protein